MIPLENWDTLKNIQERSNFSSKLHVLRKLYSTKLNKGGNLITRITKLMELIDTFAAVGKNIALVLCLLPPLYHTQITALKARIDIELTSSFIKSKLINNYNRRVENSENSQHITKPYKAPEKSVKTDRQKYNKFL